jgi:hypothetical protein
MPATYTPAETVFLTWLRAEFPDLRVVTELPADLGEALPCIRVTCFGGANESAPGFDNSSMSFDCFAATRDAARTLAYEVRQSVTGKLPGQMVAGCAVVRARTTSGPFWTPWDNTSVRRFTVTGQFRLHTR